MATNKISVRVESISSKDGISRLDMSSKSGVKLALICLDSDLKKGDEIEVGANPTNIAVGVDESLSISNQIPVTISEFEKGKILTKISAKFEGQKITAIITTTSADKLNLIPNKEINFLIKATDMFVV